MTHSFLCALISLLFAGANDTLLKRQATSGQCQSQYMAIAGAVWSSVFVCSALCQGQYYLSWITFRWTSTIGVLSAVANYMLIYSMRKLEASVASTIYRLNLALAAIIAFVFLAEPINFLKVLGLMLACFAVFCFAQHQQRLLSKGVWPMLFAVVIASAIRAVYGICYKMALAKGVQYMWLLSGPGLGWTVLGCITALRGGGSRIPVSNLRRGMFSGLLLCGLVFFFAKALEYGQASVIIPVSQMSFVVTAVLAWPLFRERPSLRKIFGLILACLSICVLSQSG